MVRKIRELDNEVCLHPEHDPPMHIVFATGVYEHICPGCGFRHVFTVQRPV